MLRGHRGRVLVGFITTYPISVYITTKVLNAFHGKVYSKHYITFVGDLRQVAIGGFFQRLRSPPLIKLTAMI